MTEVYIGVGSNIEPEENIPAGCRMMRETFGELRVSRVWRTSPVGMADGTPDFLNLVVGFGTGMDFDSVYQKLQDIETRCGRGERRGSCGEILARTLDLDLLLYGDLVRHDESVNVPRVDIIEYAFVYEPLVEIAPSLIHPETGRALATMREELQLQGTDMHSVDLGEL